MSWFLSLSIALLWSFQFSFAIRMPLGQIDPFGEGFLINEGPQPFWDHVRYCHNYPDIMCYTRHGNGDDTIGDKAFWTLASCTDSSGLGAVEVRFPRRRDILENGPDGFAAVNGLYHPRNNGRVVGSGVTLFAAEPSIRFHPGDLSLFLYNVPFARWPFNIYVTFSGPPDRCFHFSLARSVYWQGQDPPSETVPSGTSHDEL